MNGARVLSLAPITVAAETQNLSEVTAVVLEALQSRAVTWEAYAALGEVHEIEPARRKAQILRLVIGEIARA